MENTEAPKPKYGWREMEQRTLAIALANSIRKSGKNLDLADTLADFETEMGSDAGLLPDEDHPNYAYSDEALLKLIVLEQGGVRDINRLLADAQETMPEIGMALVKLLAEAAIDALADRSWSPHTMLYFKSIEIALDMDRAMSESFRGWVVDIASDKAHEVRLDLMPAKPRN